MESAAVLCHAESLLSPEAGKAVLMSRESSSMSSTWSEYLCIERLDSEKFAISTCTYQVLGSVYELIPEDTLFDANGDMVIPNELNGQAVWLDDNEYLMGGPLTEVPSCDPVQFSPDDLERALEFCRQTEWTNERHFMRVWRQVQQILRRSGGAPAIKFKPVRGDFQPLIDDLVDRAEGRGRRRRGFKRLGAWVVNNDWDALVDDSLGGGWNGMALEISSPWALLSDSDLLDREPDTRKSRVSDDDRVRYARAMLAELLQEGSDACVHTVHAYPLRHTDGTRAVLCGVARSEGQAGPTLEWHGVFKSLDRYQDWLPSRGFVHEDDLADMTDAEILAAWRREPPRRGRGLTK